MKITPTRISDVLLIESKIFSDNRGFFIEAWHQKKYSDMGLEVYFVQDNLSRSYKGVLRGLHYQLEQPQGKLVRVINGAVFDVAVDIRLGSPTFGEWVGEILTGDNCKQLYIPPGFAHGFCVLSDTADFLYKCTDFYAPQYEQGILWNDPAIAISWPGDQFIVSQKDMGNSLLNDSNAKLPTYMCTA